METGSTHRHLVWALVSLGLATPAANATDTPIQIPTQGFVRDNAGELVAEGVFAGTFAPYARAEGVEPLPTSSWPHKRTRCDATPTGYLRVWSEVLAANLGSVTSLGANVLAEASPPWLGLSVEGEPEPPRRSLGAIARASESYVAATRGGALVAERGNARG